MSAQVTRAEADAPLFAAVARFHAVHGRAEAGPRHEDMDLDDAEREMREVLALPALTLGGLRAKAGVIDRWTEAGDMVDQQDWVSIRADIQRLAEGSAA